MNPAASLQAATSLPLTGADASLHAPNNLSSSKGKAKVSDNDSSNSSPPLHTPSSALEWQVITKKKPIHIALALEKIPGKSEADKKTYAYNMIGSLDSFISMTIKAISTVKHVNVTFDTQQAAEYACTIPISNDDTSSFELVTHISATSPTDYYSFKLIDVPLDVDKDVLKASVAKFDKIKSIKFVVKGLYYHVTVSYESNKMKTYFDGQWSYIFQKTSFCIFPLDLPVEQHEL